VSGKVKQFFFSSKKRHMRIF